MLEIVKALGMFGITSAATVKQIEGQPFALVGGLFLEHDSGC